MLRAGDLHRSQQLKVELQQLKLSDYFDDRGGPRFRRLGLSFAAKQHEGIKDAFGSRMLGDPSQFGKRDYFSAKAAHRAHEAVEKDALNMKTRTCRLLEQLTNMDRHHVKDVYNRQLEMIFSEVPNFTTYVPPNVRLTDLLPVDAQKEDEFKERRLAERWNGYFTDKYWIEGAKMGWLLPRPEVLQINEALAVFTRAARGGNCPLGMDRPTFCRFILDCHLVDQQKVPFFWATSLFDAAAKPMHICPPDATWASTAPATRLVNRWTLISVLDGILRQHYDGKSTTAFSKKLARAVKHRLPPPCRAELEKQLQNASLPLALEGEEVTTPLSSGLSEDADGTTSEAAPAAPTTRTRRAAKPEVVAVVPRASPPMPAWLRPPERPASSLDTHHEKQMRDRLIQSMLVEPEVLNVVMQYFPVVSKLHACYSDGEGHMDFSMLLQFCSDFRLIPELVASEFLKTIYDSVLCLDWSLPTPPQAESTPKAHSTLQAPSSLHVPRGRARQAAASARGPTPLPQLDMAPPEPSLESRAPERTHEVAGLFGPSAFLEALCKVAFWYLGFYGNIVQQSTAGYTRVVWLMAYLRCAFTHLTERLERVRMGGVDITETALVAALRAVSLQSWEKPPCPNFSVLRLAQPLPGSGVRKTRRRKVNAGHPIRLKPSLPTTRLGKGRASPASSGKLAISERNTPRSSGTVSGMRSEEEVSSGKLSPVSSDQDLHEEYSVDALAPKALQQSQGTGFQKQLPATPSEEDLWALEDLFKAEAGEPSIVDGTCTLCGHSLDAFPWGNPGCRGCSAMDGITLDQHPFKRLLTDKPPGVKVSRPKAKRPTGSVRKRDSLSLSPSALETTEQVPPGTVEPPHTARF